MPKRSLIPALLSLCCMACGPQDPDVRRWHAADVGAAEPMDAMWHYDTASDFHGVLPFAVQNMRSDDPFVVAHAVCRSLGGELDFMLSPNPLRNQLPFNCAFIEHDTRTSVELGELRRIRNNSPAG